MEILSQAKQYMVPAAVSVMAIGLLKIGLFVTHGDLEQSLRLLETSMRAEYATRRDIDDIKQLLGKLDSRLSHLDERLADLQLTGLQEETSRQNNEAAEHLPAPWMNRTIKRGANGGNPGLTPQKQGAGDERG